MVDNPSRSSQGGDVSGTRKMVVTQGEALAVSNVSFDPGYGLGNTLSDANVKFDKSDLVRGYCDYGAASGEPGSNPMTNGPRSAPEKDPAKL